MAKEDLAIVRKGHLPIYEDECSYVWEIPVERRCEWIQTTKDCSSDSLIPYSQLLFCTFGTENTVLFVLGLTAMIAWLLYLFLILGSTADNLFYFDLRLVHRGSGAHADLRGQGGESEKCAAFRGRIPSVSDPDVLRTYLANRDTVAIPRIPMRTRPFGLRTKLDIAIATELKSTGGRSGDISAAEEASDRPKGLFKEFFYDVNPISGEDWRGASNLVKFILVIRSPFMLPLQLFIPVVNLTAPKKGWSKLLNCSQLCLTPTLALFLLKVWQRTIGPVPVAALFLVVGAVIGLIVFLTSHVDRVPKFHNAYAFLGFFAAMLLVYTVAGEVMAVLQCIGFACRISDAMLGITLLALGNSVGDLISNVTIAHQGFPRMGYAACFGGPMFNTLLGLGLTYGIAAASSPDYQVKIRTSDMAPGCIAFLLCSLLCSVIYLNITGAVARRSYGYLLYSIYSVFLLMHLLSELHVIHPLGTDHRSDEHDHHK